MDRQIVYPGAIPLDTDILNLERNVMIAQGFVAQGAFGTATTTWGLACNPTSPASMSVLVGPGALLNNSVLDQTAFGSLAADTSDALVKVGINLTATTLTTTAPASSGQSINYLIEASFLEEDTTPVVLPYYNASNPAQPYTGPANSGAPQNTQRIQRAQLQLKAGTPANTGTQTTPAVDAGWVGLYVVTVAFGQTTVTSGNISLYPGAPFVSGGSLQVGRLIAKRVFSAPGTTTYVPTAGTNRIRWRAVGGGGSGGGTPSQTSSQAVTGTGGTAGAYCEGEATSGFVGVSLTVGGGGSPPTAGANAGNAGGATSLGSLFSCPGGNGGGGGSAGTTTVPNMTAPAAQTAAPTGSGGTFFVAAPGGEGTPGIVADVASLFMLSGNGGRSQFGPGGPPVGQTLSGVAAASPGAGGSGGASSNGGATAGGAGASGLVIIEEYSA